MIKYARTIDIKYSSGKEIKEYSSSGCNFKQDGPYKFYKEGDTFEKKLEGTGHKDILRKISQRRENRQCTKVLRQRDDWHFQGTEKKPLSLKQNELEGEQQAGGQRGHRDPDPGTCQPCKDYKESFWLIY